MMNSMDEQAAISRTHLYFKAILALAILLRVAGGMYVAEQVRKEHGDSGRYLFADSKNFASAAFALAHDGEYRDEHNRRAWRMPGYSVALAVLIKLGLETPVPQRALNMLFDLLTILLLFRIASRLAGPQAGLFAAAGGAAYPFFIYFSNLVLAESLALLLVTGAAACWLELPRAGKGGAFLAGLALAGCAYAKASLALLGVPLLLVEIGMPRGDAASPVSLRMRVALVLLAFCMGLAPWWIRNAAVFDAFVPLSTMGGFTLYESVGPESDGGPNFGKTPMPDAWRVCQALLRRGETIEIGERLLPRGYWSGTLWLRDSHGAETLFSIRKPAPLGDPHAPLTGICIRDDQGHEFVFSGTRADLELKADAILRRAAFAQMRCDPVRVLLFAPRKVARMWNLWPNYSGASGWRFKAMSLASYLPVLLLALVALLKTPMAWRAKLVLLMPALYLTLLHSLFMGSLRYRLPAMGCLLVLAALGADSLLKQRTPPANGPAA